MPLNIWLEVPTPLDINFHTDSSVNHKGFRIQFKYISVWENEHFYTIPPRGPQENTYPHQTNEHQESTINYRPNTTPNPTDKPTTGKPWLENGPCYCNSNIPWGVCH